MILAAFGTALLAAVAAPSAAPDVADGLRTALKACEQWVNNPATHAERPSEFAAAAGLVAKLLPQAAVPDFALPPPQARVAMRHWRVPVGTGGIFVTVSDVQPICHLAGGGPYDMQPELEAELASASFRSHWKAGEARQTGEMLTTRYDSKDFSRYWMVVSRADRPNGRTDRVQLLVTAQFDIRN